MDPLSHGILGAIVPMSLMKRSQVRLAAWVGFLAGLLPDIDFVIQSKKDPLLFLEYHRQFTHSLLFIPIGGWVVAFLLKKVFRSRESFKTLWIIGSLGYGMHPLLDACTSYGTQLFWPISHARIAWHNVSIVDPIFTITLLVLLGIAFFRHRQKTARIALLFALSYLSWGFFQRAEITNLSHQLAEIRGHVVQKMEVKPSFGNMILWKSIYEAGDRYYVDAIRFLPGAGARVYEGSSVEKLKPADTNTLPADSVQAKDIERFRWFSNDFLSLHPEDKNVIIDMRYSTLPQEIKPLWGIRFSASTPEQHVPFETYRTVSKQDWRTFWSMLCGKPLEIAPSQTPIEVKD